MVTLVLNNGMQFVDLLWMIYPLNPSFYIKVITKTTTATQGAILEHVKEHPYFLTVLMYTFACICIGIGKSLAMARGAC